MSAPTEVKFKAAAVQMEPRIGEKETNVERALRLCQEAAAAGARLIVLPELFNSGYVLKSLEEAHSLAEAIPDGPTTKALVELAADARVFIVAGLAEAEGAALYNSAVVVGPEGYLGKYRKKHLWYEENLWFSRGDRELPVYQTRLGRFGVMVCYDSWFPELARALTLRGADVLLHPANWGLKANPFVLRTRALENHVYLVSANRVGSERGRAFGGQSLIANPEGEVVAQGSPDREEVVFGEVDLARARAKQRFYSPYNHALHDRRSDIYG